MSITVRRNFGRLADIPLVGKDLMHNVGLLARERILRRTAAGEDSRGYAFRPYSPGYAKLKNTTVPGSHGVNLQVSGDMLNAIGIVDETDTTVVLGFTR